MNGPGEALSLFLEHISASVRQVFCDSVFIDRLPNGLIKDRIMDYSMRGGKYLRPALVSAATGAVGGEIAQALPVAVAVEMFHTWTLVHDDIIDRDTYRRGGLTMHARIHEDFLQSQNPALHIPIDHLSHSMALLIGDAQHGMVMDLMARSAQISSLPPELVLQLILELEGQVLPELLTGEVSDVLQSTIPLANITLSEIETMLHRKTGALLTYSVISGGYIGLRRFDPNHPHIKILRSYGQNLGLAFQMHDDLLGIVGNQEKLGKPVGSDFREGKRTMAIKIAYDNADSESRKFIESHLGQADLSTDQIESLKCIVQKNGGVDYLKERSEVLIDTAVNALESLPQTPYREILADIARFTVNRNV